MELPSITADSRDGAGWEVYPSLMGAGLTTASLVVLVGVLVWLAWSARGLRMAVELPLLATSLDLDPWLFQLLGTVTGATLTDASYGRYTLSVRRVPGWALVAMILTFPFGLVFLLVRRPHDHLHLAVVPRDGGQALRITGVTDARVWRRTCRALAPVLAPAAAMPAAADLRH